MRNELAAKWPGGKEVNKQDTPPKKANDKVLYYHSMGV